MLFHPKIHNDNDCDNNDDELRSEGAGLLRKGHDAMAALEKLWKIISYNADKFIFKSHVHLRDISEILESEAQLCDNCTVVTWLE